nr:RNA-dependent RNA polymerase [Mute swan feces associated picobirnavirus 1]
MTMKEATKWDEYFRTPNPGLRAYFKHVEAGSSEVIRTPFYKNKKPEAVLKDWMKQLAPLKHAWPTLFQFEVDLSKKVGPMSVMKPLSKRMDDIEAYYAAAHDEKAESIDAKAVDALLHEWRSIAGLRVRSQTHTVQEMKKSTNSGSPYFTKRKAVVDKTVPVILSHGERDTIQRLGVNTPNASTWNACAVLGWRGQEGGPNPEDVKQRVVWMFPFAVNIAELQVYQPLIAAVQRKNLVPAWVSMDQVDMAITNMFDTKPKNDIVLCTDFTAFDQHFGKPMQEVAECVLDHIFSGQEMNNWLKEVFPIKYDIPMAYNYGKIRFGSHGMASGSGGTNADETISHRALQYEAAIHNGADLNPYSQCLGDDGVLTYPGITVDQVVESYTRHGLEMNTSKQYASTTDCEYLRRWHHVDYRQNDIMVGVYATTRALGRLMYQERFIEEHWGPIAVALRQLSIIENVKYHPLREEFAAYCMKGDKFRLGLDIPHFLDRIEKHAAEMTDYMPDFLGYTKSMQKQTSINDWWIVNFLKSKA